MPSNNNTFQLRKDQNGIPVAALESATDSIITATEQLVKITATATTSASGQITVPNLPIAALLHYVDHQGNLQESYGITNTGGYTIGNIDPVAGTFTVYTNSGMTTTVNNTSVTYTYYFLAPALGTLNSDGTMTPNVALTGSNTLNGNLQSVTTPGTRVQLPNIPCREVTLIGLTANTGNIYIGGNNVSASVYGAALQAKDSITLTITNANMVYIDADVAGEGISYVTV